jgi:hypothetical protein
MISMGLMNTSCSSKKEVAKVSTEVTNAPLEKSLLWKVSGNKLKKPSYVFGTIHMIGTEDFFLPEGTENALESTDAIIFEIDMADMNDLSQQLGMLTKIMMPNGLTLDDLLSEEDYELVRNHFEQSGLPMFMLNRVKPMFLTVFAGDDIDPMSMNFQSGEIVSYEFYFFEEAQGRGMETGGLETIDFQMSVFDSIPYEDQAQMLVETIKIGTEGEDQFEQMVAVYKEQDIDGMIVMMEGDGGFGGYEDILLRKRNEAWIPRMETIMLEKPAFFAVGAGHLGGPNGVINLLKKRGYTVVPVKGKQ